MRKPSVLNVPIRVAITAATEADAKDGAKYSSVANVKITPYGSFEARSCGTSPHSARKFAQAFVLKQVADAILAAAETHEAVGVTNVTETEFAPLRAAIGRGGRGADGAPRRERGHEDEARICALSQAIGQHSSSCVNCARLKSERGGIRGIDHG